MENSKVQCDRCPQTAETVLHTVFGMESLCTPCRDAIRRDGQGIASPYPLSLEEFAAYCSWRELIRLAGGCCDIRRAARRRMQDAERGDWLFRKGKRTEWTGMVERWYRTYSEGRP